MQKKDTPPVGGVLNFSTNHFVLGKNSHVPRAGFPFGPVSFCASRIETPFDSLREQINLLTPWPQHIKAVRPLAVLL